jgi:hypothetical protein
MTTPEENNHVGYPYQRGYAGQAIRLTGIPPLIGVCRST